LTVVLCRWLFFLSKKKLSPIAKSILSFQYSQAQFRECRYNLPSASNYNIHQNGFEDILTFQKKWYQRQYSCLKIVCRMFQKTSTTILTARMPYL
jgi:hypothetical protein